MRVRHWAGGVPLTGPPTTASSKLGFRPQPNLHRRHHHFRFRPSNIGQSNHQPLALLRPLFRNTCPPAAPARKQWVHFTLGEGDLPPAAPHDDDSQHEEATGDETPNYELDEHEHDEFDELEYDELDEHEHDELSQHQSSLQNLLTALRQEDSVKLYRALLELTRGADPRDPAFYELIAALPATTFSALLRAFDPLHIQEHLDSAPGLRISYGAAIHTPLGELVNKWGTKVLYVIIYNRLRLLQAARRSARIRPLLNDYSLLMRCAATAADHQGLKTQWIGMRDDGYVDWLSASLYTDFIQARFLTVPLYSNNDLSRLRLRAIDLHKSYVKLSYKALWSIKSRLINLRRRQLHRFGQNPRETFFAQPLSRALRHIAPLRKLERSAFRRRFLPAEQRLACALLVANGRNGRLVDCWDILWACWDIMLEIDWKAGTVAVSGGADFPPGSPQAPTEELLEAVVHCFGNQALTVIASELVDYISKRYNIPVPNKVWSDLLDYIRIAVSKPASQEWRVAGFSSKLLRPSAALDMWELSTSAPHDFQPGVRDYHNLSKCLVWDKSAMGRPLAIMKEIRLLYTEQTEKLRLAWRELLQTTAQKVPNYAAYRRYRVLLSEKHYMWYCFHYTALQILKKVKPMTVDDEDAVRTIPKLVLEFSHFMPRVIRYRIATGDVELRSDLVAAEWQESTQLVHEPGEMSEKQEQAALKKSEWLDDLARVAERAELGPYQRDMQSQEDSALPRFHDDEHEHQEFAYIFRHADKGVDYADELEPEEDEIMDDTPSQPSQPSQQVQEQDQEGAIDSREEQMETLFGPKEDISASVSRLSNYVQQAQISDRPALLFRPLGTISSLPRPPEPGKKPFKREQLPFFSGYHDHPRFGKYAAHRDIRTTLRKVGVAADLKTPAKASSDALLRHVLWMR